MDSAFDLDGRVALHAERPPVTLSMGNEIVPFVPFTRRQLPA